MFLPLLGLPAAGCVGRAYYGDPSGSGGTGSGGSGSGGSANTGADGGVLTLTAELPMANPCTSNAPGPRKLWRLSASAFAASIHSIFNDTSNAAPVATVFSDPTVLGFSVDANALLVQDLNASQLEDNAEAIAAWAASERPARPVRELREQHHGRTQRRAAPPRSSRLSGARRSAPP